MIMAFTPRMLVAVLLIASEIVLSKTVSWTQIPGGLQQMDAGPAGAVWGVNSDLNIFKMKKDKSWTHIIGVLKHVSAGQGGVWGIMMNDFVVYREGSQGNSTGTKWTLVPGLLKQIDSGPYGIVWGVTKDDIIFLRTGISSSAPTGTNWQQIAGGLKYISCGEYGCWGVDKNNRIVFRSGATPKNPAGTSWKSIEGRLKQIEAGPKGAVWGVDIYNLVWYRAGVTKANPWGVSWVQVPGRPLKHVSVGADGVFGVDVINASNNGQIWRLDSNELTPSNLAVTAITVNSAMVMWDRPAIESSVLTAFLLNSSSNEQIRYLTIPVGNTYVKLRDLLPSTTYTVDVGAGPWTSARKTFTTRQEFLPFTKPPVISDMRIVRLVSRESDDILITCKATGSPPLNITWYKDGVVLRRQTNLQQVDNQLNITSGGRAEGNYECRVKNKHGAYSKELTVSKQDIEAFSLRQLNGSGERKYTKVQEHPKLKYFLMVSGIAGALLLIVIILIILTSLLYCRLRKSENNFQSQEITTAGIGNRSRKYKLKHGESRDLPAIPMLQPPSPQTEVKIENASSDVKDEHNYMTLQDTKDQQSPVSYDPPELHSSSEYLDMTHKGTKDQQMQSPVSYDPPELHSSSEYLEVVAE